MCGIAGIFHADPATADDRPALARMSERLAHRGPDDHGTWTHPGVGIVHRRLAVVDATPAGAQPMLWLRDQTGRSFAATWQRAACPADSTTVQYALAYNGELYNDAELRAELSAEGVEFRSRSDTETVLAALATWGFPAVDRFRGMYALAITDVREGRMLLARDPLGIKPLYYAIAPACGQVHLLFASELPALLSHPFVPRRPDPVTISSYLTTIRTTLGERTLYQGVHTLEPGQRLEVSRCGRSMSQRRWNWWDRPQVPRRDEHLASSTVAEALGDSVRRHLRSDVPLCCLLSGGLDSSIVSLLGKRAWEGGGTMTTFCAGADASSGGSDDFAMARLMAGVLGSTHVETFVTREQFHDHWRAMVGQLEIPLSTPNEVAINQVARRLRAEGFTVALSGEGADELFGGYDAVMSAAAVHASATPAGSWRPTGGRFQLDLAAWVTMDAKGAVLADGMFNAAERDDVLRADYDRQFAECSAGLDDSQGLEAHLRFQRRINLQGLLRRLDQATMLESVEGRTPFADQEIALLAESLPMERKFVLGEGPQAAPRTKAILREAFAGELPPLIVQRPKASFPLPFQDWVGDAAGMIADSFAGRQWFSRAAVALVTSNPAQNWRFAWPMANLAMWTQAEGW